MDRFGRHEVKQCSVSKYGCYIGQRDERYCLECGYLGG
jgi:hypothetical protein